VVKEQQKIRLLKAEQIAAMLGLKVQTVYAMDVVVNWRK
jgi:predicted DNA-binding transcriptional regulator AlpA